MNSVGIERLNVLCELYQKLLKLRDWEIKIFPSNHPKHLEMGAEVFDETREAFIFIDYDSDWVKSNGDIFVLIYYLLKLYFRGGNISECQGINVVAKVIENNTKWILNKDEPPENYDLIPF